MTDKINQLPKKQTTCKDCGAVYGRHRSGTCNVTDFAHAWVTKIDFEAENKRLVSELDRKTRALEGIEPRLQGIVNHGKAEFHCKECEKRFTTALFLAQTALRGDQNE